jgi:hypothetical protein
LGAGNSCFKVQGLIAAKSPNGVVELTDTPLAADLALGDTDLVKAYDEVADFIARRNPGEVAGFKPSEEARSRAVELVQQEKSVGLTVEERRELDHYENLELLMNLAKARARQLLAHGQ